MTTFLQLHLLTSYPPACLNRDDLNRPKSAVLGGVPRLRISSQSLKRAWRTSEQFEETLTEHMGTRTKLKGVRVYERLTKAGGKEKEARKWAQAIAGRFGKLKGKKEDKPQNDLEIEQLAHFSPEEESAIDALVDMLLKDNRAPTEAELALLRKQHTAADIAMFGRMLADSPGFNTEAACQVAHAVTVHRAAVEDDFFTAVDDLNTREEDAGSAHMGEQGFGAGLFYQYVCIDCDRLQGNLGGDTDLAGRATEALIEAAATVAPTGKQNSFASRAWAYFVLAEKGSRQPRARQIRSNQPDRM
ncbi:MAG: type I-E CRISPR-associated protein Cas7/Cse4/CasC [Pseudomonadota bacterium]|nr:type I-E CRISPR-associated protein Cas7/Cse4/CasC [Pseudomonadota bacterium]